MSTKVADSAVSELEAFFLRRNDIINRWGNIISSFQALPGLVGFWPMSSVQRSTGNAYDLSGQGRTLTRNGNPTYNIYNGLVPYIDLDGAGDFLSRADETDLDILGTETIFASAVRGLTLGGWFYPTSVGAGLFGLMSKYAIAQVSFLIYRTGSTPVFVLSTDGTNLAGLVGGATMAVNAWHFIVGRFIPSTENAIFVNGIKATNTIGIPASIFNSTTAFEIGRYNLDSATCFTGRAALTFLCANALPDTIITGLFEQSRLLFGQ